jgi:tRNA-specific 2-thiouridylase
MLASGNCLSLDNHPASWLQCEEEFNCVIPKGEDNLAVVAMSGGVDSSVAAVAMSLANVPSIGVSLQVWDYRQKGGGVACSKASCCAPSDFNDARSVASKFNIPYYVFDMEQVFEKEVINKFIDAYYQGNTPNPCVECNNKVKFRELRERGLALGGTHVVTGHYARVCRGLKGFELHRGVDRSKDQSYFLYGLLREELAGTIFPLGHLEKSQVRSIAAAYGLVTASKPESQDICFVSGSVQEFITRVGRRKKISGDIVLEDGTVIGNHEGVHNFTVGQRRGVGVGGNDVPLYVIALDPVRQQVTVGPKASLQRDVFWIRDFNWLLEDLPVTTFEAIVQVRSRHEGTKVRVSIEDRSLIKVEFIDEWIPVAAGQAGVIYGLDNSRVFGGGTISSKLCY